MTTTNNTICVLSVEDEPISQMVLQMFLRNQSKVVGTGAEALDTIKNHHDDIKVVFMDLGLPDMDGIAVTQQIRQFEHNKGLNPIYICALTSDINAQKRQECLDAGMNDFLTKPVNAQQMNQILQHAKGAETLAKKSAI